MFMIVSSLPVFCEAFMKHALSFSNILFFNPLHSIMSVRFDDL